MHILICKLKYNAINIIISKEHKLKLISLSAAVKTVERGHIISSKIKSIDFCKPIKYSIIKTIKY